jgi:hypothetical protein
VQIAPSVETPAAKPTENPPEAAKAAEEVNRGGSKEHISMIIEAVNKDDFIKAAEATMEAATADNGFDWTVVVSARQRKQERVRQLEKKRLQVNLLEDVTYADRGIALSKLRIPQDFPEWGPILMQKIQQTAETVGYEIQATETSVSGSKTQLFDLDKDKRSNARARLPSGNTGAIARAHLNRVLGFTQCLTGIPKSDAIQKTNDGIAFAIYIAATKLNEAQWSVDAQHQRKWYRAPQGIRANVLCAFQHFFGTEAGKEVFTAIEILIRRQINLAYDLLGEGMPFPFLDGLGAQELNHLEEIRLKAREALFQALAPRMNEIAVSPQAAFVSFCPTSQVMRGVIKNEVDKNGRPVQKKVIEPRTRIHRPRIYEGPMTPSEKRVTAQINTALDGFEKGSEKLKPLDFSDRTHPQGWLDRIEIGQKRIRDSLKPVNDLILRRRQLAQSSGGTNARKKGGAANSEQSQAALKKELTDIVNETQKQNAEWLTTQDPVKLEEEFFSALIKYFPIKPKSLGQIEITSIERLVATFDSIYDPLHQPDAEEVDRREE